MAIQLPISSCGHFILSAKTCDSEEIYVDVVSILTGNYSVDGTTTVTCSQYKSGLI